MDGTETGITASHKDGYWYNLMKGYTTTLPRSPELESHHQMQFCVITRTLFEVRKSYPSAGQSQSMHSMILPPIKSKLVRFGSLTLI